MCIRGCQPTTVDDVLKGEAAEGKVWLSFSGCGDNILLLVTDKIFIFCPWRAIGIIMYII